MGKTKIGFVGVGNISGIYLKNLTEKFTDLEIVGVCDLVREKAQRAVDQYGMKLYKDMYELFADPAVDIVLNITRPAEHFEVSHAALEAGKHVYSEKPLAGTFAQGKALVELAQAKGLVIAGAPDTFLGAGVQGCRKLLAEDVIGAPIGAAAHMICHGHETWHPDPEFYYRAPGGGPMLDMGPYYVTALCQLMGPVKSVMGMTRTTWPTRAITSQPLDGTVIDVDVPTHQTALLRFQSGAVATLITTFDAYSMPGVNNIEIYGERGNMIVPDPNSFGGEIKIKLMEKNSPAAQDNFGGGEWIPIDTPYDVYHENCRGVGLADMAAAIQAGRLPRAGAATQTLHVLEVLTAIERSSGEGREIAIESPFEAQRMLPVTAEENCFS
ncbi:MAG: Gfo/Idh/MocA family oxidoreductase [Oscillospiraceae bacterium]|jgi:predicted dehydrogenase|nr:Gfo/Idh/MocA family oxidoreductase [Oscillospiraceae bacterium]